MRAHLALFLVAVQALDFGAFQGEVEQWFPADSSSSSSELTGAADVSGKYIAPQAVLQGRRVDLPPYGPPILLDPLTDSRRFYGPYPARRIDNWVPTEFVPNLGYAYRLHDGLEYVVTDKTTRPVIRRKRGKMVAPYTSYLHPYTASVVDRHCYNPVVKSSNQLCTSLDAWRCLRSASFYHQVPRIIDIRESPSIWGFQASTNEPSTIVAADGLRYGVAISAPVTAGPRYVLPRSVATLLLREIDTRIEEVKIRTSRLPYSAYAVDLDDAALITIAPLQYLRGVLRESVSDIDTVTVKREISLAEAEGVKNVLLTVIDGVARLPDLIEELAQKVEAADDIPPTLADLKAEDDELTSLAFIQTSDGALMTITPSEAQQVLSAMEVVEEPRVQSVEEAPASPAFGGEGLLDMPFTLLSTLLGGRNQGLGNGSAGNLMSMVPGVGNLLNNLGGGQQQDGLLNLAQIPLGLLGGVLNGGAGIF